MNKTARAIAKHIHISPKKLLPIVCQICGKTYNESISFLKTLPYKKRILIWKVLYSAVANLISHSKVNKENIIITTAFVTKGSRLKRIAARAKGKAYRIEKKMSHLTIIVKEINIQK